MSSFVDNRQGHTEVGAYFGNMVPLLTKGKHSYMIRYYMLPKEFKWGDENLIPKIAGSPLRVNPSLL